MKNRLSFVLFLITFLSFAQNKFESGYYIDNSGTKTECLIRNLDWKNNPINIEIKNTTEGESISKKIEDIKEFSIYNKSKYVKATVKIDQSSQNENTLTNSPSPVFLEKTVLLKVLVEGNSNLYYFEDSYSERYFYSLNGKIEQLIYKRYNNSEGNISFNEGFKQQLFANFKCNSDEKSILALKYNNNNLIDYFVKTNNCISGETKSKPISEKRKIETNFKVNILLNSTKSNYHIPNGNLNGDYETEKTNTISFGFETEIVLPYNNKNWSVIIDPSYIKNEGSVQIYKPLYANPNYTLYNEFFIVRIPLGIRKYFKINSNNSFFANASYTLNGGKAKIHSFNAQNSIQSIVIAEDNSFIATSFSLGVGYQFKRYSAEIKFNTKTNFQPKLLTDEEYSLNQMSLKLGYRIF